MNTAKTLQSADEFAKGYDEYIIHRNWNGPAFFFGMMYTYIEKEEKLLDLGTGTGLNSMLFKKAGLQVYGIDGSAEMLEICRGKKIAIELAQHNLAEKGYPFSSLVFDHIVSYAVFHLLGDLEIPVSEISVMIRRGGIFGFSVAIYDRERDNGFVETDTRGLYEMISETSGVNIFRHTDEYVNGILAKYRFHLLQKAEILAFRDEEEKRSVNFWVYLAQKS
jgi:predicted TPR repeat methyltransferase